MAESVIQGSSQPSKAQARWPALPSPVSFWVSVAMMVLFMYAAAAPTPLYRVYQAKWGFSAATLTAVFAIYVLFLVVTLLTADSLSDHVGRRPLMMAGIVLGVVACVLFLVANGVGLLFAARALQGIAVGVGLNTLGAVLMDLRPTSSLAPLLSSVSPNVGLATGALLTAILVQYGSVPTDLVWYLLLAAFAAVTIAAIETGTAAALLLGTGIAGLGFGPAFLGAYRTVVALAAPGDRAGLIAAIFTVSYLSMGLPALIAGIVDTQVGLHGTALVYSAAVAGLAGLAAATFVSGTSSRTTVPQPAQPASPAADLPPGPCTVPPYVPAARQDARPAHAPL